MTWLLDTCVVSDYFRRRGKTAEAMHAVAPHQLAVSAITEHELRFGLLRQPQAALTLASKVRAFLSVVQVLQIENWRS